LALPAGCLTSGFTCCWRHLLVAHPLVASPATLTRWWHHLLVASLAGLTVKKQAKNEVQLVILILNIICHKRNVAVCISRENTVKTVSCLIVNVLQSSSIRLLNALACYQ